MTLNNENILFWDLSDGRTILATEEFVREHYPNAVLNQEDRTVRITRAEQEAARKAAYIAQADPLFFMSQRGEATVEEWQTKVAEIKAAYPYPSEQ